MARPKKYTEERVATAIRVPRGLHHRLQDLADAHDVSVNFLITRAIERYLGALPQLPETFGQDSRHSA